MNEITTKEPTIEEIKKNNDTRRNLREKKEQASLAQAGRDAAKLTEILDNENEHEKAKAQANKITDDQVDISDNSIKSERLTHVQKIAVPNKSHISQKATIKAAIKAKLAQEHEQKNTNINRL